MLPLILITLLLIFPNSVHAISKKKPAFWNKAESARWLAHSNLWGTLSTSSQHLKGRAWGQPKSFVDGSESNSTGVLYFYDSDMDTSLQDIKANPYVSFSMSMAQLGRCTVERLDPENPRCARVVMSGKFVDVTDESELAFAKDALFERHPEMATWPDDHSWRVHKIILDEIWLINIYGGASIVDLNEYYKVDVSELDGAGLDEAQPEKAEEKAEEEEEYPKVRVEAYVEALCPYCKDFVVGPLTDALSKADIAAIVDLKIVPYGNTKYYENGSFVCQHGQDECISDAYMLCSLYKWNGNLGDISTGASSFSVWPYIQCLFSNGGNPSFAQQCYQTSLPSAPASWEVIEQCYMNEYAVVQKEGMGATPSHEYVPWVIVNGEVLEYSNLLVKKICSSYTGPLPESCSIIKNSASFAIPITKVSYNTN